MPIPKHISEILEEDARRYHDDQERHHPDDERCILVTRKSHPGKDCPCDTGDQSFCGQVSTHAGESTRCQPHANRPSIPRKTTAFGLVLSVRGVRIHPDDLRGNCRDIQDESSSDILTLLGLRAGRPCHWRSYAISECNFPSRGGSGGYAGRDL